VLYISKQLSAGHLLLKSTIRLTSRRTPVTSSVGATHEGGHAAQHAVGDGEDDGGELADDTEQNEPARAPDARTARRATGQSDDPVVLERKRGKGRNERKARQELPDFLYIKKFINYVIFFSGPTVSRGT
jgi:hypothetical protein